MTSELAELAGKLYDARKDVSTAQHTAEMAVMQIASHEKVCSERYENIRRQLDSLPAILNAHTKDLGNTRNIVYIGVGIWLGTPVIAGFLFALYSFITKVHP